MGYAFVDLATAHEAQSAIQELSGKEILERKVSVQAARKTESTEAREGAASGGEGGSGGEGRKRGFGRARGRGRGRGGRLGRGGRARNEAVSRWPVWCSVGFTDKRSVIGWRSGLLCAHQRPRSGSPSDRGHQRERCCCPGFRASCASRSEAAWPSRGWYPIEDQGHGCQPSL